MKRHFLSVLACIGILNAFAAQGNGVKEVKLAGYIGGRIDGCIEKRVLGQSVDELVEPFKAQDETKGRWASESRPGGISATDSRLYFSTLDF